MIEVGSDFSGVGAFEQALMRLGIKHKTIFACDMDKYARQTYIANYGEPNYFPLDVYDRKIPNTPLDIYCATPPCQSFSLAGKRKGEDDKRGVLFYNSHEFIQKNKPRYFIFENVKGLLSDDKANPKDKIGRTFRRWLDYLGGKSVNGNPVIFPHEKSVPYHIYYKVLNAKHYGVPQNRERIFIIGIRDDQDNVFTWPKPIPLLKRLKDVLEENVDEKYYLSDSAITKCLKSSANAEMDSKPLDAVSRTLIAGYYKIPFDGQYIKENEVTNFQGKDICNSIRVGEKKSLSDKHNWDCIKIKSKTKKGYEISCNCGFIFKGKLNDKCPECKKITSGYTNELKIGAIRGRNPENPTSRKSGLETQQMLEINESGVSNALTTVQKDNVIVEKQNYIQWDVSGKGYNSQQDRTFYEDGIMGTIPASRTENKVNILLNDYKIRRLTPREAFRLMDFQDSFKMVCSDTQMYKQAGNSIVVAVLYKILKKLKF